MCPYTKTLKTFSSKYGRKHFITTTYFDFYPQFNLAHTYTAQ